MYCATSYNPPSKYILVPVDSNFKGTVRPGYQRPKITRPFSTIAYGGGIRPRNSLRVMPVPWSSWTSLSKTERRHVLTL